MLHLLLRPKLPAMLARTPPYAALLLPLNMQPRLGPSQRSLDIDKRYPDEPFTIVIFGNDRPKFGQPELALQGKRICATGKIELYQGKAKVVVHDPGQITQ